MELVESGVVAVAFELNLELQLVPLDGFATDCAGRTNAGPPQVRSGRRDGSFPVRTASRAFARRIVSSGMVALQGPVEWSCQMPGGRRPVRVTLEASMEGDVSLYLRDRTRLARERIGNDSGRDFLVS
jgi:hypothetical protein